MSYQSLLHKAASPFAIATPNILQQDVCLPAAIVKATALQHNIDWMQRFANASKVLLAPHGKTSMTGELFHRQLAAGAWGLTVATAYQAQIAAECGAKHIIVANQLVGKANMAAIARLVSDGVKVYVCCDSQRNAQALSVFFADAGLTLQVLLELGVEGGRCGCRSDEQAIALARAISALPAIALSGIEFYEGVIKAEKPEQAVAQFVKRAAQLANTLYAEQLFNTEHTYISGAGSAWYDIVATQLQQANLPQGMQIVLRPGCYVSHDQGIYQQAQQQVLARSELACQLGADLQNALEVAAYVQSLPEPGFAVLAAGKRDLAFDAGLPQVIALYRDGQLVSDTLPQRQTSKVMDQHTFWYYGDAIELQVGDIVMLSTSHPCLTFDKWRTLWLTDDNYSVLQQMDTFF